MNGRLLVFVLLLAALAAPVDAATLVVANKSDASVDLVDPSTGMSRATLPTREGPHEAAVSPDGQYAVIANYGLQGAPGSTLTVIEIATAEVKGNVRLHEYTRPHGLWWLDGTNVAVTTEGSGHLLVVDLLSGKVAKAIETGQQISHMVVATPDFKRAFVANIGSGTVTVLDLEAGAKIKDIETGAGAEAIDITPDGKEVWVGNRAADTLTVIDAQTLEVLAQIDCPGFPIRLKVTPDGKQVLVSCGRAGAVAAFDRENRKELRRAKLDLSAVEGSAKRLFGDTFGDSPVPVGLLITPDGKRAYVAATQADAVVVLDPATLDVVDLIKAGQEPDGMAYAN